MAMVGKNPSSDSPISCRIVLAFLDFLGSVELAPGVDSEALEVARDCLESAFRLNQVTTGERIRPGLLLDLFTSWEASEQQRLRSNLVSDGIQNKASCSMPTHNSENSEILGTSNNEGSADDSHDLDMPRDELFGRFYAALDKINFFSTSSVGIEDPAQIAKATQLFDEAFSELENSQEKKIDLAHLAEIFKSKGNQSMQLKLYMQAIELYTYAIALCDKNAVYYCNRAAAYTLVQRYTEAIEDCLKSIEIDQNYSKAYSRLGSAYFAQGNYHDALFKGYLRACQLDPSNRTIRENIKVTERKLMEQARAGDQNTRSPHGQESTSQSARPTNSTSPFASFPIGSPPSPEFVANIIRGMSSTHSQEPAAQSSEPPNTTNSFTSFPTNLSIPIDLSNIFGHMMSNHNTESTHPSTSADNNERSSNVNEAESTEPGVRVDANVNLNFGESPQQVSDVLMSVMQMFSSQMGSQDGTPPGSDPHTRS
uniref:Uncharacterized protein n=1 Tax=Ananas comosus var. bracteatus TaxID=296719 RepID=A0A6V7Q6A3_ANACO|nr:unnamed protein product [Ananas comosus var. bracteatus]